MTKASRNYANNLLKFINESPTPFQSVENLAAMLDNAGAVRIEEGDKWELKSGVLYYTPPPPPPPPRQRRTWDMKESALKDTVDS